jgi:hypothetical protein
MNEHWNRDRGWVALAWLQREIVPWCNYFFSINFTYIKTCKRRRKFSACNNKIIRDAHNSALKEYHECNQPYLTPHSTQIPFDSPTMRDENRLIFPSVMLCIRSLFFHRKRYKSQFRIYVDSWHRIVSFCDPLCALCEWCDHTNSLRLRLDSFGHFFIPMSHYPVL